MTQQGEGGVLSSLFVSVRIVSDKAYLNGHASEQLYYGTVPGKQQITLDRRYRVYDLNHTSSVDYGISPCHVALEGMFESYPVHRPINNNIYIYIKERYNTQPNNQLYMIVRIVHHCTPTTNKGGIKGNAHRFSRWTR